MNNFINKFFIAIAVLSLAFACDDEDFTGDSSLTPSSPSVEIAIPESNVTMVEEDRTFEYAITLSEPQIVDVAVYIKQVGGDATLGEDFSIGSDVVIIPANRTSATAVVKVNADDLAEGTETFAIQIGDERTTNAAITPQTINFTLTNVAADDLALGLSWNAKFFDASGEAIDPTDLADLIFYITDANGAVIDEADGAGFEELTITGDMADGEYLVKAGMFAVVNPGDLGNKPMLDLELEYSQAGTIDPVTVVFPAAYNTSLACAANRFTLVSIVKAGSTYTVTEVGEAPTVDVSPYVGAYNADEPGYKVYPVNFTAGTSAGVLVNDNFWDAGASIAYVFGVCDNMVTIPSQDFDLGGTVYTVTGSGTVDPATKEIVVDYRVTSGGTLIDSNTHTFTKL